MKSITHRFEPMTAGMRPQDDNMDGSTLTFETLEHGGDYPDLMPQAIRVTDAQGRECTYVPITVDGQVVRSHGFSLRELEAKEEADAN